MTPPPDGTGIRDEVALALDIIAGLFEHSPVGFAFLDTELRYVRINPALARVQRRPVEAHLGRRPAELFGDRAADAETLLRRVLVSGWPAEHVDWTVSVPGEPPEYYLSNCYPLRSRDGALLGVAVSVVDVTSVEAARREAQLAERARASEARFRALLESAPDAILIADGDGRIVLVNAQVERLFGYHRDDLVGAQVEVLLPDRLGGVHRKHRAAYAANPQTRPMGRGMELLARRKDGTEIPVEVSLSPLHTPEGLLITTVIRDISDRRRAEAERAELMAARLGRAAAEADEARARLLAEATTLLASDIDYEDTFPNLVRLVVSRLADLCAIDVVEADGSLRRLAVAHHDPTKERLAYEARERYGYSRAGPIVRAVSSGRPELLANVSDGFLESVSVNVEQLQAFRALGVRSAMFVPLAVRGRVLGVLTVGTGDSDRRYTEADLVLAEEVGRHAAVAVETTLLFREAEAARRQAEEANRGKDEFLAVLSHELRTPLNSMLGWARVLEVANEDDLRVRAIKAIERSVAAQSRLIEDLLDVSRIIAGKLEVVMQTLDLRAVVVSATEALRPAAHGNGVTLTIQTGSAPALVRGDPGRLEQVARNVISNAVKFTPARGSVEVRVDAEDGSAHLIVIDSGEGIDAEFLPRIFDRFTQANSSITRAHAGLGLGLTIARHVITLHGGQVEARSAGRGLGATFIVTLPSLANVHRNTDATTQRDESSVGAGRLRGIRVLVVEDDPESAEVTSVVLAREGADVDSVASAAAAMAAVESRTPDVLVCDIGLPDEDGRALMQRIRQLATARGAVVPAIAFTAYAQPSDRASVLASGFDAYLAKPVEPSVLIGMVAAFAGLG